MIVALSFVGLRTKVDTNFTHALYLITTNRYLGKLPLDFMGMSHTYQGIPFFAVILLELFC
jgi:hypothetical protein